MNTLEYSNETCTISGDKTASPMTAEIILERDDWGKWSFYVTLFGITYSDHEFETSQEASQFGKWFCQWIWSPSTHMANIDEGIRARGVKAA